jgi:hypothetical protein
MRQFLRGRYAKAANIDITKNYKRVGTGSIRAGSKLEVSIEIKNDTGSPQTIQYLDNYHKLLKIPAKSLAFTIEKNGVAYSGSFAGNNANA